MSVSGFLRRLFKPFMRPRADSGMREHVVQCMGPHGLHRMAYTEWGDPDNPKVLLCVHGFTRNARDFDMLAEALSGEYRVVCPDVVGRGRSDWLRVKFDYTFPLYVSDMVTLIARLGVPHVDWVGTSMGGLIGVLLAGQPHAPVRRLVLNDVGPLITAESLRRIGQYVGKSPGFPTLEDAESYVRQIGASFGALTDEQWQHLTRHSVRHTSNGYIFNYDPSLGDLFRMIPIVLDVQAWDAYDRIAHPVLAIRGAESDLLRRDTWLKMAERGPKAKLAEFPGIGHAPMLMSEDQIAVIRDFLLDSGKEADNEPQQPS
ncbi:MAG: alpha/beta hydrolase [Azoarcus sp.]|jgi:pimeloyl-ACP methyl ester carboxylesterase|nr:alpha/beta hydrolase [Azoarcus sp.]